jgi:hypothetical protein
MWRKAVEDISKVIDFPFSAPPSIEGMSIAVARSIASVFRIIDNGFMMTAV